jgi:hypothetical protein
MAVLKCPICNQFLVGFEWTKTAKGKNWLKHKEKGEWHDCPNKKLKKKTSTSPGQRKIWPQGSVFLPHQYDSNEPGFYCLTCGHDLGGFENMSDNCDACGRSTNQTEFRYPKDL